MAKTYNNLYPEIYSFQNLLDAYRKARRNKRYKEDVLQFSAHLEERLISIQNDLIYKTYKLGSYREFYVYDPKLRLIMAAPFRDRVMHHALCNVIEPIFEKRFINDSYACRTGKGTHNGVMRTIEFIRTAKEKYGEVYCFKGDVSKFFMSVNHGILKKLPYKRIHCRETLWLLDQIIRSTADQGDLNPKGMPVGNLTSQLFANIYLSELDYFMKYEKKNKYYVRYMDDFLVISPDKEYLHQLWKETADFLQDNLALSLNKKTAIFPVSQGIDFLGYRIWDNKILLRKGSITRIKRAMKRFEREIAAGSADRNRIRAVLVSWLGHAEHANVPRLREKIILWSRENMGIELSKGGDTDV